MGLDTARVWLYDDAASVQPHTRERAMNLSDLTIPPQHAERLARKIRRMTLPEAIVAATPALFELLADHHPVEIYDLIAATIHRSLRKITGEELDQVIMGAHRALLPQLGAAWSPDDMANQRRTADTFAGLLTLHVAAHLLHVRPRLRTAAREVVLARLAMELFGLPPLFGAMCAYTASRIAELGDMMRLEPGARLPVLALRVRLCEAFLDTGAVHMHGHAAQLASGTLVELPELQGHPNGPDDEAVEALRQRARRVLATLTRDARGAGDESE